MRIATLPYDAGERTCVGGSETCGDNGHRNGQVSPSMIRRFQERNGQKVPNASQRMNDHMKDMTPEQRKQFEEMMKLRGVDPNATDTVRLCYSQKMVDRGAWTDQGGCKTDFTNRSATSWKWHSVCSELGYEGEGEATFSDADNFTVKSSGVSTAGGKTIKVNSTRTGKWLSADCGGVKPMDAITTDAQ